MKNYKIKPEYLYMWGDMDEDYIVTEKELNELAREWDKEVTDLLGQLVEADMRVFARDNGTYAIMTDDDMTEIRAAKGLRNVLCCDPEALIETEELVEYDGDPNGIVWDEQSVYDENGNPVNFDAAVQLMDDEIREELHNEIAPCTNQKFLSEYAKLHEQKYGEGFAPYVGGNW